MSLIRLAIVLGAALFAAPLFSAVNTTQVNVYAYSGGSVTTSAYTTLVASTPMGTGHLEVCDTSGSMLKIALGAPGNETDLFSTAVSGCVVLPYAVRAGSRLSIKAIDATASSGYNVLSFMNN